ncbi:MAG: hypothetical protein HYY65_05025 [Candidatus Tectomicrobia bacterium]|uniref:Uncharacterized protein n=1 Tax=Tectimicrobiota bacterium TaxID=2528274 RepID=A0A932GP51_UNCTE|nr:hypothetical protein [Candidatus Tectomicrobia bacterium]
MNRRALRLQLKIGAVAGAAAFLFVGVPWGIFYGGSFGLLSAVSIMGSPLPERSVVTLFVIGGMALGVAAACLFWLAVGSLVALAVGTVTKHLVNKSLERIDSRETLDSADSSGPTPFIIGLRTVQHFFSSEDTPRVQSPAETMKGGTGDLA